MKRHLHHDLSSISLFGHNNNAKVIYSRQLSPPTVVLEQFAVCNLLAICQGAIISIVVQKHALSGGFLIYLGFAGELTWVYTPVWVLGFGSFFWGFGYFGLFWGNP